MRREWLCWQSAANPSLPANLRNTGRIRQRAGKAPNCPCRTSQHPNDSDGFLPALTSRENLVRSRDAGDISFRKSGMTALSLKADMPSVLTDDCKVPIADTVPKPRKGTASAISIQPGLILLFCRFDIGKIVGAEPGSDVPLQLRWPCESNPPVPERLPEANIAHPNSR